MHFFFAVSFLFLPWPFYLCRGNICAVTLVGHRTFQIEALVVSLSDIVQRGFFMCHKGLTANQILELPSDPYFLFLFYEMILYFRESPAIYVAKYLLEEGAKVSIFDPKVSREQILM